MPSLCVYVENGERCREKAYYGIRGEKKKTHCSKHKSNEMTSSPLGHRTKEEGILQSRMTRLSVKTINDYQQQLIDMRSTIVLVGIISPVLTENAGTNCKIEAFDTKCVHIHGTFCNTTLYNLLNGSICFKCANNLRARSLQQPITREEIIARSRALHRLTDASATTLECVIDGVSYGEVYLSEGDKYGYFIPYTYTNDTHNSHIYIVCRVHGGFRQTPHNHYGINKSGCPQCGISARGIASRLGFKQFEQKSKELYGDEFRIDETSFTITHAPCRIYHTNCKRWFEVSEARVHLREFGGCSFCTKKTQTRVYDYLISLGLWTVEWEHRVEGAPHGPYDIAITYGNRKVLIELDGSQHFVPVRFAYGTASTLTNLEEQRRRDVNKMKFAISRNLSMIRIIQEDVVNRTFLWTSFLIKHITALLSEQTARIVFQDNPLYDEMKQLMSQ